MEKEQKKEIAESTLKKITVYIYTVGTSAFFQERNNSTNKNKMV